MKVIQYAKWSDTELSFLFMIEIKADNYTRREDSVVRYKRRYDLAWEHINEVLSIQK